MCYCPRMSSRTPNFTPARRPQQRANAREATDFLDATDGLGSLLPIIETLTRLQADCERLLPPALTSCKVLKLHENILQLAVPNAAVATRLRTQQRMLATMLVLFFFFLLQKINNLMN